MRLGSREEQSLVGFFFSFFFFSFVESTPAKDVRSLIRTERNTMERYKYFATYDGLSNVQV